MAYASDARSVMFGANSQDIWMIIKIITAAPEGTTYIRLNSGLVLVCGSDFG